MTKKSSHVIVAITPFIMETRDFDVSIYLIDAH